MKNISRKLIDVRPPSKETGVKGTPKPILLKRSIAPKQKHKTSNRHKPAYYAALIIAALFYIITISAFKNDISETAQSLLYETNTIKQAFSELNTEKAAQSLETTHRKIKEIESQAKRYGLFALSSLAGTAMPNIGEIPGAIKNFTELSEKTLKIAEDLNYLKKNGLELVTTQKGNELIAILERLEENITNVDSLNASIKNQSAQLKSLSPSLASISDIIDKNYIPISVHLYRTKDFLHSLIYLLKQPLDLHLLLIFQNPSEMRPAGGFIGSFGNLVLNQANLKKIVIDDIYNADRQFDKLIIPPQELQSITKKWGARDANWFFDFPTSAKKVIEFLEQSELFYASSTKFQGAIAMNVNILGTLLEITGPIELEKYELVIDRKNFLKEIQYEVEAGQDKKPGQNPKKILSVLTPILLEKLQNLDDEQKSLLVSKFKDHFEQKDIMVYFKNWGLQNFVAELGVAGDVVTLPKNFSGDYLAVINANIAGGKTDAFINQHINLKSIVSEDGKIINELAITRTHNGQNEKEWWYNIDNKNYIKIFTPQNSKLTKARGNNKKITELNKYSNEYKEDSDLITIEDSVNFDSKNYIWTGLESGKTTFGAWFDIPAGKSKSLELKYIRPLNTKIKNGLIYKFIFEKQSGANTSLEYSIDAPEGYIWAESGTKTFEYGTQQPLGREIVELTLRSNHVE